MVGRWHGGLDYYGCNIIEAKRTSMVDVDEIFSYLNSHVLHVRTTAVRSKYDMITLFIQEF